MSVTSVNVDLSNAFLADVLRPFAAKSATGWAGLTVEQVTDRMTERRERPRIDIQEAIGLLVDESRLQQVPPHLGNEVVPPMRYTITDRGVAFLEATNAAR